jgi:hypothetical protein
MRAVLLAILMGQTAASQPPPGTGSAPRLTVAPPKVLVEIDTGKVGGEPVGLAWNADGTVYLRVAQGKDQARHYLIATSPSVSVGQSDGVPEWAAAYWARKSGLVAPDEPNLAITVESRQEKLKSVNTPSGGSLAGTASAALPGGSGGEGVSQGVAVMAATTASMATVVTMRLHNQVVAEWMNENPQPGVRLGWAPAPMGVLAYVDAETRLVLIDRQGRKVTVPGSSKVLLPGWSVDGSQVIYLQKSGSKAYQLMVAAVGPARDSKSPQTEPGDGRR